MDNKQFPEDFFPPDQGEDSAPFQEDSFLPLEEESPAAVPDDAETEPASPLSDAEYSFEEPGEEALLPEEFPSEEDADPLDQELMEIDPLLDEPSAEPQEPEPQPEPEEPPVRKKPAPERPVRKGRPRRKKGEGMLGIPNILATVIWLAITVAIGVTLGRMLWVCAATPGFSSSMPVLPWMRGKSDRASGT